MAWGALPTFKNGSAEGGLPLLDVWMAVSVPLFLVAGESDTTTKPDEVLLFRDAVASNQTDIGTELGSVSSADSKSPMMGRTKDSTSIAEHLTIDRRRVSALKTCILPKPASHGLLYDFATYRTLAGLIQTFLSDYLDFRLSLGWQLHHMKDANKWDVKNLAKWQAVNPVSEPIGGIFRAMKVLRETDSIHSPAQFVEGWKDKINAVIDISHDPPVYSPQALSTAGIEYHKFPTVSKIPPTSEEVKGFIVLVNNIRASVAEGDQRQTCVHCHYGFNRTGFFICSYLVESMGYSVQDAIDEFAKRRPPGIRHDHFIDTLFVRYCVGLKRAPTL